MRDRSSELGTGTTVALITFTDPARLVDYQAERGLPFPVLSDPHRATYRAYGLGRGSVRRVWGARAARRYVEVIRRNGLRGLRIPREDPLQLGGDFVVAPDGTLSWGFWGKGPDDRPSVDALIAAANPDDA